MAQNDFRQEAREEHAAGMLELKAALDGKILAEAAQGTGTVTAPEAFGVTLADIEQERTRLIAEAERIVRRGWTHVMATDRQLQDEEGEDYYDDSVVCHDEFVAQVNADKTEALARLDEVWRMVSAFNSARLDVYNALRGGDAAEASRIATEFVRRPVASF